MLTADTDHCYCAACCCVQSQALKEEARKAAYKIKDPEVCAYYQYSYTISSNTTNSHAMPLKLCLSRLQHCTL
jgi:hypothetical protein